jgi:hypothetical protein
MSKMDGQEQPSTQQDLKEVAKLARGYLTSYRNVNLWMRAENKHLGGVPAELVKTKEGVEKVKDYFSRLLGR